MFDGFERVEKVKQRLAEEETARAELEIQRLDTILDVWSSYYAVLTSLRQVQFAQAALSSSQENFDASQTFFEDGLATISELVSAQNELAAARSERARANADYLTAIASFTLAMGGPVTTASNEGSSSKYPPAAMVFWVGETGGGPANTRSVWDPNSEGTYGGVDDPVRRNGFEPVGFRPLQNPFYVALPYCDMQGGRLKAEAARLVPWFIAQFRGPGSSVCKGHWLEIRHGAKTCYAQWEDVGPFRTDSAAYVFGNDRPAPNINHGAGIDVSPAVRIIWDTGLWTWLTGDLLSNPKYSPGCGHWITIYKTSRETLRR